MREVMICACVYHLEKLDDEEKNRQTLMRAQARDDTFTACCYSIGTTYTLHNALEAFAKKGEIHHFAGRIYLSSFLVSLATTVYLHPKTRFTVKKKCEISQIYREAFPAKK